MGVAEAEESCACGGGKRCAIGLRGTGRFCRLEDGPATAFGLLPETFVEFDLRICGRGFFSERIFSIAVVLLRLGSRKFGADWTPIAASLFSSLVCRVCLVRTDFMRVPMLFSNHWKPTDMALRLSCSVTSRASSFIAVSCNHASRSEMSRVIQS